MKRTTIILPMLMPRISDHAAVQLLARETVHGDIDALARSNPRQLGLLVVGDDIDVRQRHHIDQTASDIDVVAGLHLALADDAGERSCDLGVTEF